MSKENILFTAVGVLLGFIVGFVFANSANRAGLAAQTAAAGHQAQQVQGLPPGHPPVDPSAMQPQVDMAAVGAASKLAEGSPNNFDAQVKAAELNYQARRYDEAVKFYAQANKLKPEDYDVIVSLGNTTFDAEKFAEAEKWYATALAKRPDDVNVRTDMGLTFMFREPANYERAIAEFNRSLEYDPNHMQTLQNLTVAYIRSGGVKHAEATLARLETAQPQNPVLPRLRADLEQARTAPQAKNPAAGKAGD